MMQQRALQVVNTDAGAMDVYRLGQTLAKSGYFADTKEEAQAVAKILYGQELGVPPVSAMLGIHIIQGKPAPSAGLMAAIIKRSGRYTYRVRRIDAEACELEFFERGESIGVSSFTVKDAQAAELTTGRNSHSWRHFARNMLFARALSNGARWYCPDVFGGPVYTPDELGAVIDGRTGEVLTLDAVVTEASRQTQTQAEQRQAALGNATHWIDGEVTREPELPEEPPFGADDLYPPMAQASIPKGRTGDRTLANEARRDIQASARRETNGEPLKATEPQVKACIAIPRAKYDLTEDQAMSLCERRFGEGIYPHNLTRRQASEWIDEIKAGSDLIDAFLQETREGSDS